MAVGTHILKEVHGRSAPSGFVAHVSRIVKRCLDVALAAVLLVLLLPVFFVLAAIVLLDDGWPIFYRRRVVGQNGEFDAFKFRSMRRDAGQILERDPALKAEFEQNFKLRNDPRLTRIGEFLRKHSLDELPQLLNVIAGQMSLVGPRMITAPELEKYGQYRDLLLSVRPGITGYWQVNGRQDVGYEERVAMDIRYIENWSLWLDIKILCLTPLKVIKREGAY
jgi:lipopolysaccharide/colanic/teichoic acid biosynthesis glycosyltransferase